MKDALHTSGAIIEFTKKDGTQRTMICIVNMGVIPEQYHPKHKGDSSDLLSESQQRYIRVFDLEKKAWRCIPKDNYKIIRVLNDKEAEKYFSEVE